MDRPAIIVISSHVVRGTVGTRAAAFALEVIGFPVWTVPTITLPWHPGHAAVAGLGERIVAPDAKFSTMLDQLATSPWIDEVGGVLSGYLGSASQAASVARLVKRVKAVNPEAVFALDPVIGDHGRLYVPEEQAEAIRNEILPLADIAAPNPFELQWLAGTDEDPTNEALCAIARSLGPETVIVTSAEGMMRNHIGNLMLSEGKALLAEHPRFENVPNGLGDLTAALMLAYRLNGQEPEDMLRLATATVYEVMRAATLAGAQELTLERNLDSLLRPSAQIKTRTLFSTVRKSSPRPQAV
ncbi:MAG: pyridoxal kinase [Rhizobiaceae bacterium]